MKFLQRALIKMKVVAWHNNQWTYGVLIKEGRKWDQIEIKTAFRTKIIKVPKGDWRSPLNYVEARGLK